MSVSSSLLFDHFLWLLLLMPCLGLILTYFTKRTKPYRKNGLFGCFCGLLPNTGQVNNPR